MRNERFLSLLLCLLLCIASVLALSACGGDTDDPADLPTIEGVTFKDATYTYDGKEKTISVEGAPEGATVTYEPGNSFTDRGTYKIKATVSLEGYQDLVLSATLTIYKPVVLDLVTVTFDSNGGTAIAPVEIERGTVVNAPETAPYRRGYEFQNWYNGDYKYDFTKTVDESITLTAKWKIQNFEIIYDVGFGINPSQNPTTYNIESDEIVLADAVALEGGTFEYWYVIVDGEEQQITSIPKGSDGNKRIYAKYKYQEHDITYVLGGGTNDPDNPPTSNIGTPAIPLKDATLLGYDFVGWYTDSSCTAQYKITEIPERLSAPMTVYASYTPTVYTINYNGVDSSELPSGTKTTYTILQSYTFPDVSNRTDYSFGGWLDEASSQPRTGITAGSTGNIVLNAQWTPKTYNITYNLNGGTNNSGNPATFNVETPTITLLTPTRNYYDFKGWTDKNGQPVTQIALGTSGSVTLNANWKATDYTITYNLNEGKNDSENPATYTVEDAFTLAAATRTGYKFLGWYTENNTTSTKVTQITLGSHGPVTLYAQWEEYDASIAYNAMGGTLPKGNPSGYDPTEGVASFLPATKAGYTFAGWYTSTDFLDTEKVESIAAGTEGDFTLYAKFVYGSSGLQFTANGNYYSVSGYNGTDTVVCIPETYNGKDVTAIAANAFKGNTAVTSVIIPDTVTTIGADAFNGCTALNSIVIPATVTTIDNQAFFGCTSLTVINCKAESKPAGYSDTFNKLDGSNNIDVVWGYKGSEDENLPVNPF